MNKLVVTTQVFDENSRLGFFVEWVNKISEQFESVDVICLEKGCYNVRKNVTVLSMGKEKGNSKLSQILNFYKYIIERDHDMTFVHMNPIWVVLGWPVWFLKSTKINMWYAHVSNTLKLKLATLLCNKVISSTEDSFVIKTKKLNVVGQGIDTDLFNGEIKYRGEELKIVSTSRISRDKDFLTAFKALKGIKFRYKFDIYGQAVTSDDITCLNELRSYAKENSLNVEFKGLVKHDSLPKLYRDYDIFVNQSRTDSLDKAVLEAMSCRMLVLTSNNSFKKWISNKFTFIHGDVKGMTEKLYYLAMSNEVYQELDINRKIVVDNHSLNSLAKNISEVLQ